MTRHRFHSISPYFAMFPEEFVRKHVLTFTDQDEVVFDPFSGRGTTVFESLLLRRSAFGTDTNPVAVCLSNAKVDPPDHVSVLSRLSELEQSCNGQLDDALFGNAFFCLCFHRETLTRLLFLREILDWRRSREDRFIAAVILGCLQGDPTKTKLCLSNRMPRTVCTKPDYSVRWWKARGLEPPNRDVFAIVRDVLNYRYASPAPERRGGVCETDARDATNAFPELAGKVRLVVTSPPYLNTTHYREDQWLRLWFLGEAPSPSRKGGDDRHTSKERYWTFLEEAWTGLKNLLAQSAVVTIRIGGRGLEKADIAERLRSSLERGTGRVPAALGEAATSPIVGGETSFFRSPSAGARFEHDFTYRLDS